MTAIALFLSGGCVGAALALLRAERDVARYRRLYHGERRRRQGDLRREALSYLPADILTTHQERRAPVLATEGRAHRAGLN